MRLSVLVGLVFLSATSVMADPIVATRSPADLNTAFADMQDDNDHGHDGDHGHDCHNGHCKPEKTQCAKFNLYCEYKNGCAASATFEKQVTLGGGEVADDSTGREGSTSPIFVVKCPGSTSPIFNNSANRFTGLLQTRIQAQTGPFPSITLPRGELHSGPETSGYHVSRSTLDLSFGEHSDGVCQVWAGQP